MSYSFTFGPAATADVPDAFTSQQATAAAGSNNQIVFDVSGVPDDNGSENIRIERKIGASGVWETLTETFDVLPLSVPVNGVAAGTVSSVQIRMVNGEGEGPALELGPVTVTGSTQATTTIVVAHRSPLQIGPDGIAFRADPFGFTGVADPVGVYDERTHKTASLWSFPTLPTSFDYLERTFGESGNPQVAIGRYAFRVFPAGNHTVQLTTIAWANGALEIATDTFNFSVGQADYSGDKTIFVGTSAAAAAAGVSDAIVVSSVTAALVSARGRTDPLRILLEGVPLSSPSLSLRSDHPSLLLDGLPGARLNWDGSGGNTFIDLDGHDAAKTKEFKLGAIFCNGLWDPTTEQGEAGGECIGTSVTDDATGYVLIVDTEFEQWPTAVRPNSWSQSPNANQTTTDSDCWMIYNTRCTKWRSFGSLASCGFLYMAGNRWTQDINSLGGGPRLGPTNSVPHNDHGSIRVANCLVFVCTNFEMLSRTGWFVNWRDENGDIVYTTQPCIRAHTTPAPGTHTTITNGVSEGGITALPANGNLPLYQRNIEVTHIVALQDARQGRFFQFAGGGITLANILILWPQYNVDGGLFTSGNSPKPDRSIIHFNDDFNFQAGAATDLIQVLNCTFIHQNGLALTSGNRENGSIEVDAAYTNVVTDGNLVEVGTSPDFSNLVFSNPFNWANINDYVAFDRPTPLAGTSVPPGTASMVRPNANRPEVGQITGNLLTGYDLFLTQRSLPDTAGATLPS